MSVCGVAESNRCWPTLQFGSTCITWWDAADLEDFSNTASKFRSQVSEDFRDNDANTD